MTDDLIVWQVSLTCLICHHAICNKATINALLTSEEWNKELINRLTLWNHVEWHRVRSVTTVAKAGDDRSLSDFSSFKTLSYWFLSLVSIFSHLRIHLLARAASKDVRLQPGEVDDPQKLSWIASPQSRRSPEHNFISTWKPRWKMMKIDYLKHDFMNEHRFRAPKVQSP